MMATTTSDDIFVWAWPLGDVTPVPAGVLSKLGGSTQLSFRYGNRYKSRPDAIPLYGLPLDGPDWHAATHNLGMPAAVRDAAPDSWGRRVILHRLSPASVDTTDLDDSVYLLQSGSDRPGAIDFQESNRDYLPRNDSASLDQLLDAAEFIQSGTPLPDALERALLHGTAIGGARPKSLLDDNGRHLIAKFSTTSDNYDVVGAEAASIFLAAKIGIPVTRAEITRSIGRKVLLLERFDRSANGHRKMVVSGLTILKLPETFVPLGSYPALLEVLLRESASASGLAEDVFRRAAFNIAIGNTDDHLRNHAALWDGRHLELTPAYDLSPVLRSGETASQAIGITWGNDRTSSLATLVEAAADYTLERSVAQAIARDVIDVIRDNWNDASEWGELDATQRQLLFGRAFLNPGAIRGI